MQMSHQFMANRWGNSGNSIRLYFWGLQMVTAAMKLKDAYSFEGKLTLARHGVSRDVPCSTLKGETVPVSTGAQPGSGPTGNPLP